MFERIELNHLMKPLTSDNVSLGRKNKWHGTTKATMPTLAWDLELSGDDVYGEWADRIDKSAIQYDVEVYDSHQMVYYAKRLDDKNHTVEIDLEPCKDLSLVSETDLPGREHTQVWRMDAIRVRDH